MATKTMKEISSEVAERGEMIVDLIKTSDKPVTLSDLCSVTGVKRESIRQQVQKLSRKYPQIKISTAMNPEVKRQTLVYSWVEKESLKNSEGYQDTTAQVAIENTDNPSPQPGEIWSTIESNGSNGLIFVLNSLNGAAQCIKLYPDLKTNRDIVGSDPFQIDGQIGDITHVTFKPLRYCVRCTKNRDDAKLMEARKRLAQVFGIRCFTPEVIEKEVVVEDGEKIK